MSKQDPTTRFYRTWHKEKSTPLGLLSPEEAHTRLEGKDEICLVIEVSGQVTGIVEIDEDGDITASVLHEDGEVTRKAIYERHGQRLFLNQTFEFKYNQEGALTTNVWTACSEEGDVRVETMSRGRSTSHVAESKADPGPRWSQLPDLENLSELLLLRD